MTPITLIPFSEQKPENGKFVAFLKDGAAARLFSFDNGHLFEADGFLTDLTDLENDCSHWAQMPDDFKYWWEE